MKSYFAFLAFTFSVLSCTSNATTTPANVSDAVTQAQNGSQTGVKTVNSTEAKTLLEKQKNVVILDVRTPEEYKAGHLKNATLLNKYDPEFESKLKQLDRNKTYLVYCKIGGRSADAASMMQNLGFKNVLDATEGFSTLKKAGVPVD